LEIVQKEGSTEFVFSFNKENAHLMVEKGSVTINGTSLTIFEVTDETFRVAIIPYTFEHTTIQFVQVGSNVNLEFDILGKYVARLNHRV
jgi:riboflavin synthase